MSHLEEALSAGKCPWRSAKAGKMQSIATAGKRLPGEVQGWENPANSHRGKTSARRSARAGKMQPIATAGSVSGHMQGREKHVTSGNHAGETYYRL